MNYTKLNSKTEKILQNIPFNCSISSKILAKHLNCSEYDLDRHIQYLESKHYIEKREQPKDEPLLYSHLRPATIFIRRTVEGENYFANTHKENILKYRQWIWNCINSIISLTALIKAIFF